VQGSNISSGCPAPRDDAGTSTQIIDQGRSLLCVNHKDVRDTNAPTPGPPPGANSRRRDPAADDLDRAGRGRYTGSPALTPSRLSDYPLVKEQCRRLLSLRPNSRGSSNHRDLQVTATTVVAAVPRTPRRLFRPRWEGR